ncbi:MAG: alpha/beta hydrolase [Pseudonocardia sp. 73-21]|nr:MAG: alpha/beta hydrolase [Pseudonocardia sp. 73-21]
MSGVSARRRSIVPAVLCAVAALLAGCSRTVAGDASPDLRGSAPVELARFYDQVLSWGPCAGFATTPGDRKAFADRSFDCARLEVPLDYAEPAGTTASIGVLRQKATGARIGSLVVNPGGPGASGMSAVPAIVAPGARATPLPSRFDLVGFDPRGVGASTPTIDCLDDADWTAERADLDVDPSPAGVAQTEAENRRYAQRCAQRSGGPGVLAGVGTRDVARDLDILRAALGDHRLTYLGYSYGTRIGSTYAEAFPQNVRAMVLDGAVDPAQTAADQLVAQYEGFQRAFDAYAADCAPRPGCPVGADAAQATARFQALVRPLVDEPARTRDGRAMSYSDAVTGVVQALYSAEAWPTLTEALSNLTAGDGTLLDRIADLYYGRGDDGRYDNTNEALLAVHCVDDERVTDRAAAADLARRVEVAAPFADDGRAVVAALDPCAFWPVPPTGRPHVPEVTGLPPTLTVSVTGDPATPYQAGVDLAKGLNGSLLTVRATQHTASLQGNPCVDDIVSGYLVELTTPPTGATCDPPA